MSQTPTPGELIEIRRVKAIVANAGYYQSNQCFIGPTGPQGPQGLPGYIATPSTITSDNAVLIYTSSSGIVGSQLFTFTSSINPLGVVNLQGVMQVGQGITTPYTQLAQQQTIPFVSTGVLWYNSNTQSLFVDGVDYEPNNSVASTINYITSSLGYFYSTITTEIVSSVVGLGSDGYVSTASLTSTTQGLGQLGYLSSPVFTSSITGLGSSGYLSTASLNNALFTLVIPNTSPSGALLFNSQTNTLLVKAQDFVSVVTSSESYNNVFFTVKGNISNTTGTTRFGLMNSSSQITNYFYRSANQLYVYTNGVGYSIKSWNANDLLAITLVSQTPTSQTVSFYVNGSVVYTQTTTDNNQTYNAAITYFNTSDAYTNIVFSGSYGYNSSISSSVFLTSYPYQTSPIVSSINLIDGANAYNILSLSNYNSTLYFNNSVLLTNSNTGNYLVSSIKGLGTQGYISSSSLISTVQGLGTSAYVSTHTLNTSLVSSIQGLGSQNYISTASLVSSIQGIGTQGYVSSTSLNNALFTLNNPNSAFLILDSATNSLYISAQDFISVIASAESYQNVLFTCTANTSDTSGATKFGFINSSSNFNNYFYRSANQLYAYTNGVGRSIKSWNSNDILMIALTSQSASNQTVKFYVNGSAVYSQATTDTNQMYKAAITYFNTGDTYTNLVFSGSYGYNSNASIFLTAYPFVSSPNYSVLGLIDTANSSNTTILSNYQSTLYVNGTPVSLNNNNSVFTFIALNTFSSTDFTFNTSLNSIKTNTGNSTAIVNSVESYNNVFFSCKAKTNDISGFTKIGLMDSNLASNSPSYYFYNQTNNLYVHFPPSANTSIKTWNSNDVLSISVVNYTSNGVPKAKINFYVNGSNAYSNAIADTGRLYNASISYFYSADTYTNVVFAGSVGYVQNSNPSLFLASFPFLQSPILSGIQLIDSANSSNVLQLSNYNSNLYFNGLPVGLNNNNGLFSLILSDPVKLSINSATNTISNSNAASGTNVLSVESYHNVFFSCKAVNSNQNIYPFGLVNSSSGCNTYAFLVASNSSSNSYVLYTYKGPSSATSNAIQKYNSNDVLAISYINTGCNLNNNVQFYVNGKVVQSNQPQDAVNTTYKIGFGVPTTGFGNGFLSNNSFTNIVFSGSYGILSSNSSVFSSSYPYLQSPTLSTINLLNAGSNPLPLSASNSTLYFNNTIIASQNNINSTISGTINNFNNLGFTSTLSSRNNGVYMMLWSNTAPYSFNSATNTLLSSSNSTSNTAVTFESYHSAYFSCVPSRAIGNANGNATMGILDTTGKFRYYFTADNTNLYYTVILSNSTSNTTTIKSFNSNDSLTITVNTSSNTVNSSYTTTFFFVNGVKIGSSSNLDNTVTAPVVSPQFKGGFSNCGTNATFTNIIFAGSYASAISNTYNTSIGLSAFPLQLGPIYSTLTLIDTLTQGNSITLSNYNYGLYANGLAITGAASVFLSTASKNNAMFTLVETDSNSFIYNPANNSLICCNGFGVSKRTKTLESYQSLFFSCKTSLSNATGQQFGLQDTGNNSFYYFYMSNGSVYTNPGTLSPIYPYNPVSIKTYNSNDTFSICFTNTIARLSNVVFSVNGNPVYTTSSSNYGILYNGFFSFILNDIASNIVITGSYTSFPSSFTTAFPSHTNYISSPNYLNVGLTDYTNAFNTGTLVNCNSVLYFNGLTIGASNIGNFSTFSTIGLGCNALSINPGGYSIAIGLYAGASNTYSNSIAIGTGAAGFNQLVNSSNGYSIALGYYAAASNQNCNSIAIGCNAGTFNQGGVGSSPPTLGNSIAIGTAAGSNSQSNYAIAIGCNAGLNFQDSFAIAIGTAAANQGQSNSAIAIGCNAGSNQQNSNAVAIGTAAGYQGQSNSAIAIGCNAGSNRQYPNAVAIGTGAGYSLQQSNAIAIGYFAGCNTQPLESIAIGSNATPGGNYSIVIGNSPTSSGQPNTITLNASGLPLYVTQNPAFYVNPVRYADLGTNVVSYDSTSFEMFYTSNVTIDSLNAISGVLSNGTYLTSDSNLKENICSADLNLCYNTLKQLPLRRFNYISSFAKSKHDRGQIGFIAQEVYPIFPKSIYSTFSHVTSTNILNLNYDQIFMSHFGATQLLISTVESVAENTQAQESTLKFLQESQTQQESTLQGQNLEIITLISSYQSLITQVSGN